MGKIQYVKGDLFEGVKNSTGDVVIAHICNDSGGWGRGFVLELSKHFPVAEEVYRESFKEGVNCRLGKNSWTDASSDTKVVEIVNMVAQHGYYDPIKNPVPLNYEALEQCLERLRSTVVWGNLLGDAELHIPKIGAGLAKGDWTKIEAMIENALCGSGFPVYVYEL